MRIFGLKNCDTCRKALKQLPDFRLVDVRNDGIPDDLLQAAFDTFGGKLLNSRSTTWRNLDEDERTRPPLELLREHPALMKRPLIEKDGQLYLGWGKDTQQALGAA
ncbi:ArsC/Spx/MgsR family protein [Roseobacteraceae bacterium NS-SX3]